MDLREAIKDEMKWTTTENGADALNTTGSKNLDFFAQSGSMRTLPLVDKTIMFDEAFRENKRDAVVLLFHTRNIRGGYGERDTFNELLAHLANKAPDIVEKNLWAVIEFGRAKDLYSLIGTKAEEAMWKFMKEQFECDYKNMKAEKGISLLAKWIATPDSSSEKTRQLGKLTASKLGYSFKRMNEYKKILRQMRAYLDLPEAKVCAGRWDEIEYAKCASRFLLNNRKLFMDKDKERWESYLESVNNGKANMNMTTVNPCEIFNKVYLGDTGSELDTMWKALPDFCSKNAMVMCDTSGSMFWENSKSNGMYAGCVAFSLAAYFAERNKGSLNRLFMTFDRKPRFVELVGDSLCQYLEVFNRNRICANTNLEAAFDLLLDTCVKGNVKPEDMPEAIIVVSDMQIDHVSGLDRQGKILFFNEMKARYAQKGYKLPQVVFWNVAVRKPTFLASRESNGASLVSGYSINILRNVFDSIGSNPYELMRNVIDSEVYERIEV